MRFVFVAVLLWAGWTARRLVVELERACGPL